MTGGLPGALPLQQTHFDAEQPLFLRVFCTKDKAQVDFEPIFTSGRACARCWGGTCPAGALLPPHTPWEGENLYPPSETREAEVDPCPDRANPALNPSRGAELLVTAEIITTCTPLSSTSSAFPGLRAASPSPPP